MHMGGWLALGELIQLNGVASRIADGEDAAEGPILGRSDDVDTAGHEGVVGGVDIVHVPPERDARVGRCHGTLGQGEGGALWAAWAPELDEIRQLILHCEAELLGVERAGLREVGDTQHDEVEVGDHGVFSSSNTFPGRSLFFSAHTKYG